MQDDIDLRLTQEEAFLLLTGARLFDKLVAGVTIHSEEKDELIRDVMRKLAERVNSQVDAMSNELSDAIVESVLGCGELESEFDELELACLDSDMEEILLRDFFYDQQQSHQLPIEGLNCQPGSNDSHYDEFGQEPPMCQLNNAERRDRQNGRHPKQYEDHVRLRLENFMREETFTYPMYSVEEKLPVLEKALLKHHCVRANYYSIARETVDTVRLNPLVLLQEDGMWLVVAFCHEKNDIFIFRVDRMKDVVETDHTFETPQNINELRCKMLATYK